VVLRQALAHGVSARAGGLEGGSVTTLETLATVRELAKESHRSARAMRRLLDRVFDADVKAGHATDWRFWSGEAGSAKRYNRSRLRAAHPEIFPSEFVRRAEFDDLVHKVHGVDQAVRSLKASVKKARQDGASLQQIVTD
jgi:hypothetical protein